MVERFEGSHYPQFLDLDFEAVSRFLGVSSRPLVVPGLTVVEFLK